jgi:hypothetical protein
MLWRIRQDTLFLEYFSFHRECAQKRLDKYQKSDCQVCRKQRAIGDALTEYNVTKTQTTTRRSTPAHKAENVSCLTITASIVINRLGSSKNP